MDTAPLSSDDLDFDHAVGATSADTTLLALGDQSRVYPLASVSKPIAALGVLVAIARGDVELDEPAGREGSTVRHLLAHSAGYAFDSREELAAPGTRRMYTNAGFELLAEHVELGTGYSIGEWLELTVVEPLGLQETDVTGSPASGFSASLRDLLAVGRELLRPSLIPEDLWREATGVQFPGLSGMLPGYGRQEHNDWGLGLEIRDHKSPHWTGEDSSPRTFGHFGQSGSFLWVDPEHGVAAAFLGEEGFGKSHIAAWPRITDEILARTSV